MQKPNPLSEKSFNFAIAVINLHDQLIANQKEYIISKQLIRSGTSIGANIQEASAAQSRKDFASKLAISSKEARESLYWLKLLLATNKITQAQFTTITKDLTEVIKMLSSSIATAKKTSQTHCDIAKLRHCDITTL